MGQRLSVEKVGMSARSDERQDAALVTIDQAPVTLDMTAAKAFPWPLQWMVVVNRRQWNAVAKLVYDLDELLEPITSTLHPFEVFLILGCDSEGFHPLRVSSFP